MRFLHCLAAGMVLLAAQAPVTAGVPSPRVVSEHTADGYSMRTFADFHRRTF